METVARACYGVADLNSSCNTSLLTNAMGTGNVVFQHYLSKKKCQCCHPFSRKVTIHI